jgi:hypothetical protein
MRPMEAAERTPASATQRPQGAKAAPTDASTLVLRLFGDVGPGETLDPMDPRPPLIEL